MSAKDTILSYFEALDANNFDRAQNILEKAQQDPSLDAAIAFLHETLDTSSDTPYVRQVIEWRERKQGGAL
jgi:hypothetical protein